MKRVQNLFASLIVTIVTSLLFYVANALASNVLNRVSSVSLPVMTKRKLVLNSYETQIAQNVVQADAIAERLEDVGGLAAIKDEIRTQILLPLQHPHIFFSSSVKELHPPKGVLFHGPPGTGKTMLARAIAAEAGVPFLSLTLANLENKYFGESSKLLNATFSVAHKMQPCVLFFDEIDGMIRTRSDADQSCVYGFKTEFLTHMDGIHKKGDDSFIVIGCTNCVTKLDPAVRRRLSKQYRVDLPTADEIVDIFLLQLRGTDVSKRDVEQIAARMKPGASGSDICDIVRRARSLQMMELTSSKRVLDKIQSKGTTAQEVQEMIGSVRATHLMQALRGMDLLREEEPTPTRPQAVADDDDEDVPPVAFAS